MQVAPAHGFIFCQHCDILPLCWVPIREVVPLLRTLVTIAIAIRVLSCVNCTDIPFVIFLQFLVCSK